MEPAVLRYLILHLPLDMILCHFNPANIIIIYAPTLNNNIVSFSVFEVDLPSKL